MTKETNLIPLSEWCKGKMNYRTAIRQAKAKKLPVTVMTVRRKVTGFKNVKGFYIPADTIVSQ